MDINRSTARVYGRLGQRGAIFGMAINDRAARDEKMIVLTADLATLSGMDRYVKSASPYRFINAGIAEQNMIGMAAGLAAINPVSIVPYLYYPFIMGSFALLSIIFRFPRKYS